MTTDMARITEYKMIVALCRGGGIGYEGGLPWPKLARDMRFFAEMTRSSVIPFNSAVVMGRKTWDSLSATSKPLKYRDNIIVSLMNAPEEYSNVVYDMPNNDPKIYYTKNINEIREYGNNYDVVWIIGGASIYQQVLMNKTIPTDEIYITFIDEIYEYDTSFPLTFQYDSIDELMMLQNSPINRRIWSWTDATNIPPFLSFETCDNHQTYTTFYKVEDVERDIISKITRPEDIAGIRERRIPDMRFLRLKRLLAV